MLESLQSAAIVLLTGAVVVSIVLTLVALAGVYAVADAIAPSRPA